MRVCVHERSFSSRVDTPSSSSSSPGLPGQCVRVCTQAACTELKLAGFFRPCTEMKQANSTGPSCVSDSAGSPWMGKLDRRCQWIGYLASWGVLTLTAAVAAVATVECCQGSYT